MFRTEVVKKNETHFMPNMAALSVKSFIFEIFN
jgi:hypothetical protein